MILEDICKKKYQRIVYEFIPKFYFLKGCYDEKGALFVQKENSGMNMHPAFRVGQDEKDGFLVSINKFYLDSQGIGHELTGKESDGAPSDCIKKPWDELLESAKTWLNTLGDSLLHVMTIYEQAAIAMLSLFNRTRGKSPLFDIQNWGTECVNAIKDGKLLKEGEIDNYSEDIYIPDSLTTDKAYLLEDHHPYFAPFFCYEDVMQIEERARAKVPPATIHEKVDLTKHILFTRGEYTFFEPKEKEVSFFRIARFL